jgi:hypothetical protein
VIQHPVIFALANDIERDGIPGFSHLTVAAMGPLDRLTIHQSQHRYRGVIADFFLTPSQWAALAVFAAERAKPESHPRRMLQREDRFLHDPEEVKAWEHARGIEELDLGGIHG